MHDDEWCNLVKRYQAATYAFYEAVDRLTAPGTSFQHAWGNAEQARIEVERAHAAILNHERQSVSAVAVGGKHHAIAFYETEELVLGDQGQSGG